MNTKWFKGVSEEEKKRRLDLITNSRAMLGLLSDVIRDEINSLGSAPISDYDSPGWAFHEADRKGQVRALKNILSLCDPTERKLNA